MLASGNATVRKHSNIFLHAPQWSRDKWELEWKKIIRNRSIIAVLFKKLTDRVNENDSSQQGSSIANSRKKAHEDGQIIDVVDPMGKWEVNFEGKWTIYL